MPYMLAPEVKTPDESTFFLKNLIEEIPSLNYTSFTTNFRDISYPEPSVFGKDQSTFDGAKIAINDDFFWSSWMNGIGYGDDIENLYSFDRANGTIWDEEQGGVYTIFDSASPDIMISHLYFDDFVNQLKIQANQNITVDSTGRVKVADCQKMPNLQFQVDSAMLVARPKDYVMQIEVQTEDCDTRLVRFDAPFHVLGEPIYRDYSILHSHTGSYMIFKDTPDGKFTPKQYQVATTKMISRSYEFEQTSTNPEKDAKIYGTIIGLIIAAVLSVASVVLLIEYNEILAYSGIGVSFLISYPIIKFMLIPGFTKSLSQPSRELPTISGQEALKKYFAI